MSNENPVGIRLLYLVLALFALFILLRFMAAFRFLIFVVLVIGLVGGGFYFIRRYWRRRIYAKSMEGQIDRKLNFCRQMLEKNKEELSEIEYNFRELQSQLKKEDELDSTTWRELRRLSDGFAGERKLRQTKIAFFQACIAKLERLKHNHQLARELENRQTRLRELREGQMEELAQLESLRSDLEYDQAYLETIDRLSLRLLKSQSPEQARALQEELEEMTRNMRGN